MSRNWWSKNKKFIYLIPLWGFLGLVFLGCLLTMLVSPLGGTQKKSRDVQTSILIQEIGKTLDNYKNDCGSYPTTEQGLKALTEAPALGKLCPHWGPKPYLSRVPKDPWKNDLIYMSDGNSFHITSYGADGKPGGSGYNADISSDDDMNIDPSHFLPHRDPALVLEFYMATAFCLSFVTYLILRLILLPLLVMERRGSKFNLNIDPFLKELPKGDPNRKWVKASQVLWWLVVAQALFIGFYVLIVGNGRY